jgi:hypothetical protein
MWPFKSKNSQARQAKLMFKSPQDFFAYQCRFGITEIEENKGLVALVEVGADKSISETSRSFQSPQTVSLRVVSTDGGFEVFAQPLSDGPLLRTGDCVIWVPMEYHEQFSVLTEDPRSGWVGFVAATIAPEIDPAIDSFRILQRYDLRVFPQLNESRGIPKRPDL